MEGDHMELIPIKGGANNRVSRLKLSEEQSLVLKQYFQHPADLRKRLQPEFSFLSYAWENGIRCIPQPLFCDETRNLGLYSFLPGRPATLADITPENVQQAVDFFIALNQHKEKASHLAPASEACISLHDFLLAAEKRFDKLLSAENSQVRHFVSHDLIPAWEKQKTNFPPNTRLTQEQLCLTPSDFGFHNTVIDNTQVYFVDFEYAGWDDPAKTVCDFFSQPKMPISITLFERVAQAMASVAAHPEECLERIRLVLPLCRLKWCCLMLNGFTDVGKARRQFAHFDEHEQLQKTKEYLCHI